MCKKQTNRISGHRSTRLDTDKDLNFIRRDSGIEIIAVALLFRDLS
jgi:hypothetical protein